MASRFRGKIKKRPTKVKKRANDLKKIAKSPTSVLVGLPSGSNAYPDGTSVILVGATHEFGSESNNIPERSFLRSTVHNNRRKYKALIKKLAIKIVNGSMNAKVALNLLGTQVASDVRDTITDIKIPPNKAGTIASKGSSNPLIDTGHLRQSITYEIKDAD